MTVALIEGTDRNFPAAMREAEAAAYIGMSRSFLRQSRMNGPRERHAPPPPFIKVGRTIRYLRADLDAWLQKFRVEAI
jgi:predicted DNA-binding transcriptional regulator AlpA